MTQAVTASRGYPAGFIGAVTAAFPDDEELCRHVRSDSNYVGRLLENYFNRRITAEEVVAAFDSGQQDELLKRSREAIEAKKLYDVWAELTKNWAGP